MDISVARHAVRAADRALSIAAKAWRWMNEPLDVYPQPPRPTDENARGIGWSGRERLRPFVPPHMQPPSFRQPTVHENINPGAYK